MADQFDRLKAALSDRYTIEQELGAGGMATVYLAEDLKHHRKVAVKVMRPELAESVGAERFLREAEVTAQLNHPHILPLLDSGAVNGFLFYVMPYVEGETLRDRMNREGQLPLDDALQITKEVAAALSYAHSHDVIHRDIKPENVLLSAGEAVVADFGIARAITEAGGKHLTETGISIGTPAYMSPEQASGEYRLDGRSDIYALGCVLYEMLSGETPYTAATPQALLAKKLSEPTPRISVVRELVPAAVEQALVRALAKAPADRLATAQQFVEALTTPGGDPTPGEAKRRNWMIVTAAVVVAVVVVGAALVISSSMASRGPELSDDVVVVLPFSNETGDAAHDVVGKILAVSIIERLERAEVGRVVPYGAITLSWEAALERRATEPTHDPRAALAAEFGAGTVVWGSVFPQRDSLRLEAEISSAGGAQLVLSVPRVVVASDGNMEGIEMVIESVTGGVAFHLDSAWGQRASTSSPVSSFAVYEAYVRAQEVFWRDKEEARREAERALALDSTYLPAMTLLAVIHMNLGNLPAADSILNEAGESYDRMAPAEKGQWEWARATLDGDRQSAYRSQKEGMKRAPHPLRTLFLGVEALSLNYPAEALEVLSGADPDSPYMRAVTRYWPDLGAALHMLGEHKRELREVRRGRARHPDNGGILMAEIGARAALGDVQQVTELVEEAIRKDAGPALAARVAALELRAHGHPEASRAVGERGLAYLQDRPAQVAATASHRYDLLLALSVLERWDDAQAMAEELVREQPSNVDYLGSLGTLAARRGQREEARRIADRLAAMEIPYDDGGSTYNRACIAALLGEKDEAVSLLKLAHQQGRPFSIFFHIDPNLESLRGYPPFEEFMRPKG